jgi:hypothetical protein
MIAMTNNAGNSDETSEFYIKEMLNILADGRPMNGDIERALEDKILLSAKNYAHDFDNSINVARDSRNIRSKDVVSELNELSEMCRSISNYFARVSSLTLDILNGGGFDGIHHLPEISDDISNNRTLFQLRALLSQHEMPVGRMTGEKNIRDILKDDTMNVRSMAPSLKWPEAIAALGLLAENNRIKFEQAFDRCLERELGVLHHGPAGTLKTSKSALQAKKMLKDRKERKQKNRQSQSSNIDQSPKLQSNLKKGDVGGSQNRYNDLYGKPEWHMALRCYDLLSTRLPTSKITTFIDGPYVQFMSYMDALSKSISSKNVAMRNERTGEAGLQKYAAIAVKIKREEKIHLQNTRYDSLDKPDHLDRDVSLSKALKLGVLPDWIAR